MTTLGFVFFGLYIVGAVFTLPSYKYMNKNDNSFSNEDVGILALIFWTFINPLVHFVSLCILLGKLNAAVRIATPTINPNYEPGD